MAETAALPDVLILGDSHTATLAAGCRAHGLSAALLGFSGNLWHAGHIVPHRVNGLWVRGAAMQARLRAVQEHLGGGSLLPPDLPVIASVGFHLGRLVPPFGFRNHVTETAAFDAAEDRLFASSALVADYAEHFRHGHIGLLRCIARQAPPTAVAPPEMARRGGRRDAGPRLLRFGAAGRTGHRAKRESGRFHRSVSRPLT